MYVCMFLVVSLFIVETQSVDNIYVCMYVFSCFFIYCRNTVCGRYFVIYLFIVEYLFNVETPGAGGERTPLLNPKP